MSFQKKDYYTVVKRAKDLVPGFKDAFRRFEESVVLNQSSDSLISNYGRNIAHLALHFGRVPHAVSVEEINTYLYQLTVHENYSESFFKQTVFGLRYWFRLFGMEETALRMPIIKKKKTLPEVLSQEECKLLFKAPRNFKKTERKISKVFYSINCPKPVLRKNALRKMED